MRYCDDKGLRFENELDKMRAQLTGVVVVVGKIGGERG